MIFAVFNTPIGALKAVEEDGFLTELCHISNYAVEEIPPQTELLKQVYAQLAEYFNGSRKEFVWYPGDLSECLSTLFLSFGGK